MTFYVYENWRAHGHTARIHRSDCSFCQNGQGVHLDAGDENGRWSAPFDLLPEAEQAAQRMGAQVSYCQQCSPQSKV